MDGSKLDQVGDEAALDAFIASDAFDQALLECFEQGIREAVAEQEALGLPAGLPLAVKDERAA
jgi:hypothetical protein